MDWNNLFSGILGSIVGAVVTILLYFIHQRKKAIADLRGLLIELRDRGYNDGRNGDEVDIKELWCSMYLDIYKAFLTFQDYTFPDCRTRQREAWEHYKGKLQTSRLEEDFARKVWLPPTDFHQMEKRINDLMGALGINE